MINVLQKQFTLEVLKRYEKIEKGEKAEEKAGIFILIIAWSGISNKIGIIHLVSTQNFQKS